VINVRKPRKNLDLKPTGCIKSMRQLNGCVYLKVTNGRVEVAPNPDFFVTEEEQKAKVNGEEVVL